MDAPGPPEHCYCSRCHPTGLVETHHILQCSACGEEVRWGWRAGRQGPEQAWWHRGDVDHHTVLGHRFTAAHYAEMERQLDLPRTRLDKDGNEVVYTARNYREKKGKAAADQADGEDGKTEEAWDGEIPEPEVRADHSVVPWPLRASVPNGIWLVLKPALAAGMEVARLTYARGPWLRADNQRPPICETWVLGIKAPWMSPLDAEAWAAVGCWRNAGTKWQFEHGMLVTGHHGEFVSAADIKTWIKEVPRGEK